MKHAALVFSLLVLLLAAPSAAAAADAVLYGVTRDGKLVRVDPATAAVTEIGPLGFPIVSDFVGMDVNVDRRLYVGQFGVGLYRVDTSTGESTFVDAYPDLILENMAFAPVAVPGSPHRHPAGTLFTSAFGNLHAVNIRTGEVDFIGWTGHDDDGVAMAPDGTLYAVDAFLALYRIDTATALATVISIAPPCYVSLAYGPDGWLYCTDPAKLWRIDPQTGAAELVGSTGRFLVGLSFDRKR